MAEDQTDPVRLPRHSKGSRPNFFEDPSTDQIMTFFLELMAEVTALRERIDTIEGLLEKQGSLSREEVENFFPTAADNARRAAWTDAFIKRVMRFHQPD